MGTGLVMMIPAIFIIYPIMVNESYSVGKDLVPIYLLGTILSSISSFLGNTFSAIKKNNLLFVTMLIGSVVNVACVHILLPLIGLQASNIALTLGFLALCVSRVVLLKKEMELKLDYQSVTVLCVVFAAVSVVYSKAGMAVNIVTFVLACAVACYIFRDIIKLAYTKLFKNKGL